MRLTRAWVFPIVVAIVATFGAGIAATTPPVHLAFAGPAEAAPPISEDTIAAAEGLSTAFEAVAGVIAPSVVTIRSTREVELPRLPDGFHLDPFFNDPRFESPFRRFFGDERPRGFGAPDQPERRRFQRGEGSGVVVSEDGYILTNSHVVADADEVVVVFPDERRYTAEVIGVDAKTDLAVIKVESNGLVPARLGDSDDLRVGQWVVAAGNPFGLSSTITTGIVSAKGRSRVGITDYEDFIQTDAAINRGNSGGPLVNLRGEVVGINTAILSGSGGNIGIGFAIPINMAREVMEELITDGRVVRGYLGVLIQDLSEGMAQSFGYDSTDGALVNQVTDDGPAARAGLRAGDIIVGLDGHPVTSVDRLRMDVAAVDPGTEVEVELIRDGKRRTFEVTIEELPAGIAELAPRNDYGTEMGMTVETLTPAIARRLRLEDEVAGVVVSQLDPLGAAARAGLAVGDVITHVHDGPVASAEAFQDALADRDADDSVRMTVRRDGSQRFVLVQPRQ